MKSYFLVFSLFLVCNSWAQDTIITIDNQKLEVQIESIGSHELKYRKYQDSDGTVFVMNKTKIARIIREKGTIEYVSYSDNFAATSKEEIKEILMEHINAYGYEHANDKKTYQATFNGDYLELQPMHINGGYYDEHIILDFSSVYEFQRLSPRGKNAAYLNIFVPRLKNEEKNKWEKYKLVMLVKGQNHAKTILDALKHYNYLLLKEKGK